MNLTVAEKIETLVRLPHKNGKKEIFYPEQDGKPMGETDYHIKTIMLLHQTLELFFREASDVRVFSDIMFYYEEGNPKKVIAPDVMVVRGVGKHLRRTFRLWQEKIPEIVFEISSSGTFKEDFEKKFLLYESFGVKEYYIFDPKHNYRKGKSRNEIPFTAFHLKNNRFEKIEIRYGRVFSPTLDLEIVDMGENLRLFNPETKIFLPTMEELSDKAEKVEKLESEVEKLKAELAKLKRQK